jgi:hypothetical protein
VEERAEMPLHGDVKTFSLPAVIRLIHSEGKTGMLTVIGANRRCCIYFRNGTIVFVSGNSESGLRLGALLKANNLIGETKLQEMLAVAKAMDKRLGTILLERGYISQDNLSRMLVQQFKQVITRSLSWREAKFVYADGLNGYVEDVRIAMDPVRVLAEGERWKEFQKLIPNDQVVFQIKPGALGSKSIYAAKELRILLLLDGKRSVGQLIRETGYSRLAVYRALAQLHSLEAIVRKGAETRPGPGPVDRLDEEGIVSLYQSLLQFIVVDLRTELGSKRAELSVSASMQQSPYYDRFLQAFQIDRDPATNMRQVQAHLQQHGGGVSRKDLIKGFNHMIISLLREEYRLLGFKPTTSTLKRMRKALEGVADPQRPLAASLSRFLDVHAERQTVLDLDAPDDARAERLQVLEELDHLLSEREVVLG